MRPRPFSTRKKSSHQSIKQVDTTPKLSNSTRFNRKQNETKEYEKMSKTELCSCRDVHHIGGFFSLSPAQFKNMPCISSETIQHHSDMDPEQTCIRGSQRWSLWESWFGTDGGFGWSHGTNKLNNIGKHSDHTKGIDTVCVMWESYLETLLVQATST